MATFWIRFFRSHSKRWDLVFIDFCVFWPFFLWILFLGRSFFFFVFFLFFFFFFFFLFFVGFFFFFFVFLSFFCLFLSFLFLVGSCRMWHQSGAFFFAKNPKKSKKVEKMTFFGVQKKGSKLDLFVPPPFLF